jgi:hypothetical protein
MSPEAVSAQIAHAEAERAAVLQIEKVQASLETTSKARLRQQLPVIQDQHTNAIRRTSVLYVAAANTEMAVALSSAVGALHKAANPTEYHQFSRIVAATRENMDKNGTQIRQLERTIQQFRAAQERPLGWLRGGLDLVDGLLGSTPFGIATSSIRSILAGVFDRGQLALQHSGLSLTVSADPALEREMRKKVKDIDLDASTFVRQVTSHIGADTVAALAEAGVRYFEQMDSLLSGLELVNGKANHFSTMAENVRIVAVDNQHTVQGNMRRLLELVEASCAVTAPLGVADRSRVRSLGDCDVAASSIASINASGNELVAIVVAYYARLDTLALRATGDQLNELNGRVQRLRLDVEDILDAGERHHGTMVGAFRDYVEQLVSYLESGNPFVQPTASCSPIAPAQEPPFCTWQRTTATPLANLKQAYSTLFRTVYGTY